MAIIWPLYGPATRGGRTALLAALSLTQSHLNSEQSKALVQELAQLPGKLEQILAQTSVYEPVVRALSHASDFLYLGRGIHFTWTWNVATAFHRNQPFG